MGLKTVFMEMGVNTEQDEQQINDTVFDLVYDIYHPTYYDCKVMDSSLDE
jgi:hypothetical protein